MSNQDKDSSFITYQNILEIYQRCRENGDWAKVYLETRGKEQFFTISVNVSAGSAADTSSGVDRGKKKLVQVQCDHQRRTAFLGRRRQAAAEFAEEARTNEVREEVVGKSGEVDSFCILLSLFGTNFEIGSAMQSFFNFVHVFHKNK